MKKNELKGIETLGGVIVIVVMLFVGFLFFGGASNSYKSISTPQVNSHVSTSGIVCQAVSYNFALTSVYNNTAVVPAVPTKVGTAYQVYTNEAPTSFAQGTTSSTSSTLITGINCKSSYKILFGDNSAYFLNGVSVVSSQPTQRISLKLQPISAPTLSFNNGSIAGYVGQAVFGGVSNGYTETQLSAKISAGVGFFGNPLYAVIFAYNSSQIQSIQLSGRPETSVPSSAVSIPAGYSTIAYSLPQIGKYVSLVINPIIITGTLPANTAVPSSINMYLVSQSNYNNNGNIESNLYVNPSTQAPLIASVSSIATSSGTSGINIFG